MVGGYNEYFPIAHKTGNCDLPVVAWFKELLSRPDIIAVGANTRYDLEALWKVGIVPSCRIEDIQIRDTLIDENQSQYSLNAIALRRGFSGKTASPMEEELVRRGWVSKGKPDYARLKDLEPEHVGPYAAMDAKLTLDIYMDQEAEIAAQELTQVVDLESKLTPVLFKMRLKGVRVDVSAAEQLNASMKTQLAESLKVFPKDVDPFSSKSLATWVRGFGFELPQTDKGNDSISNEWLLASGYDDLILMARYRQAERFRRDMLEGLIMEQHHKGRLHCQWYSTRGSSFMSGNDLAGTRSGRLASGSPSLQVIPARHPVHGPLIRGMFIPEDGEHWCKSDWASQEIRVALHYAIMLDMPGTKAIQQQYIINPKTDYHTLVMNIVNANSPVPITRPEAKTINLGLAYFMGKVKLAAALGLSPSKTDIILTAYHNAIPYIKPLMNTVMNVAERRGYVKTLLGRRRRFNEYENAEFGARWSKPLPREEALAKWPSIKRAGTYRGLNSIVQGTSAEMCKLAMVQLDAEGLTPLLTVHDELDFSIANDSQARRVKEIMEHVMELKIPVVADAWIGSNWSGKDKEIVE